MKDDNDRDDILCREGETVNEDCAVGGEIVDVGYKQAQCHNRDTRHLQPEHKLLLLEHIEYAVAYRAIDEPEDKIQTKISGKSAGLSPFGAKEGTENPRAETYYERKRDNADCKQSDHYACGEGGYPSAAFPPHRCDFAIESFPHRCAHNCNRNSQHGYGQSYLAGSTGAQMPCKIKNGNAAGCIQQ